ncbi:MAG: exonuclease SbcCD subunit D [Candidatus Gracilibacteria bacterium]|nr:exonuclease SbcCD subunit D [Candidatus Gracilibacteria bacterium]
MKFIHFADLHLGMENYGKLDPQTGLNSRLSDFLNSFDFLIDTAIKENVDLVVFAGDAFKTREPSPTYQRAFAERIKRLSQANIPVFLLVGNHDIPNVSSKADTLSIYDTLGIPNVMVASKPGLFEIETGSGPCQIIALPWVTKSHVLTKEDSKDKSIEEIHQLISEKILQVLEQMIAKLDPAKPTILACHATVSGATFGAERNVMLGSDIVLPLGSLANSKLNYVALGHLHKHQVLNENPPVVYAGSMERVDFGEEKEDKGFMMVELIRDDSKFKIQNSKFTETPARSFLTISAEIKENELLPTQTVLTEIAKHDVKDKVIKIKVKLPRSANELLSLKEIKEALKEANNFAGLQKEFTDSERIKSAAQEAGVETSPLEALSKYCKTKNISTERSKELEKKAQELISELED